MLGAYLAIPPEEIHFVYQASGKPELAVQQNPRGLQFNVSHSAGLALIAVSAGQRIGVLALGTGNAVAELVGARPDEHEAALAAFVQGDAGHVRRLDLLTCEGRRTPFAGLGIDAAVNRRTLDGKHPEGWFPEQKITVKEALEAYTTGSAYAAFQDKDRGTLKPGMLADFVVLSRDILDPKERDNIARTEVLMTVVGGRVVYEKK